jgi:flagellar protein FliS
MSGLATSPEAYRKGAVLGASPAQLVVLLYDGAQRFLHQAARAMRAREVERAHNALRRAEMIIVHLDATLDHDQGLIAERLHGLYLFFLSHLDRGRFEQDAGKLDEVNRLLGEMRAAWSEVAAGVTSQSG